MKNTLLDLDYVPTLEELKTYFYEHDFSAARYYSPDELTQEDWEEINEVGDVFRAKWDELAPDKGLKSSAAYYGSDNPLMQMRGNLSELVSEGVYKLIDECPEKVEKIFLAFQDELFDPEKADKLLNNSIDKLMEVTEYKTIAAVLKEQPAKEDFSSISNNHRAQDFDRKWNHTRAEVKVGYLEEQSEDIPDFANAIEDQAIHNIVLNQFWNLLEEDERQLLRYSMAGMTQQQTADKFGLKTHSAVTKRLAKIKAKFLALN